MKVNDNYVTTPPSAQNAIDLFKDSWASRLPIEGVQSGGADLFADVRIDWLVERRGRLDGLKVLELGPLEAAHTYMLEQAGADRIVAVEANSLAYLKCLVVKELLGLKAARFLHGDFDRYLQDTTERFDLLLASGVLYHMQDPLLTLQNMMRAADEIFIWSHFYDEALMPPGDPRREPFTGRRERRTIGDDSLTYTYRSYGGSSHPSNFCGGVMSESVWIEKAETVALLQRHGYEVVPAFEVDGAPHGPAACLYARR